MVDVITGFISAIAAVSLLVGGIGIMDIMLVSVSVFAIPNSLNIQGKLTNANNQIQTGTFNFTFRLYDAYTSGNMLYEKVNLTSSTDSRGVYDIILTEINISFDRQLYLGVEVNADGEMSPRINLTSVPYSFRANTSDVLENNNDIVKDESREFTIYGGDSVTLKWRWSEPSLPNQGIRIIYINPETLAVDENKTAADIFINSQTSYTFATASSPNTIIKVRAMGNSIDWYKLASDGGKVDTGITTIDIKSKYLDVSRQLQVKINRNENQGSALNSLFDYTLLSDCSLDGNGLDSNRNCASAL